MVMALFLDISAAYDNVNIDVLVDKLIDCSIPSHMIKTVYDLPNDILNRLASSWVQDVHSKEFHKGHF